MIAHVLLQEGGTTIGEQGMRNIAQVVRNRISDTSGHFPAANAIGIVSQGNGNAFNGWRAPSARERAYYWQTALNLANSLISGQDSFGASSGVEQCLFFQSCNDPDYPVQPEVPADKNWIHYDVGGGRAQYYYQSLPNYGCVTPQNIS